MKALILASSIFYLLGLKISNTFDLTRNVIPAEKVIVKRAEPGSSTKAADYSKIETQKSVADTLSGGTAAGEQILENK